MNPRKTVAFTHHNDTKFAVGDFYPVQTVFSYHELGGMTSPFLLLDHLGPAQLVPKSNKRGVHQHPHRGFETVTIMYAGELEHRDSTGAGGTLISGDVQWMTAGSGIRHVEQYSDAFRESGGRFEMVQLWVNLPAKDKMTAPHYQSLKNAEIPKVDLADQKGFVRVIAGQYIDEAGQTVKGIATTYTPMTVLDVALNVSEEEFILPAKHGDTTLIYLLSGRLQFEDDVKSGFEGGFEGSGVLEENKMAVLSSHGDDMVIKALQSSRFLLLTGQPILEPIQGHGFFVMNNYEEILEAYHDLEHGNFIR